jgi:hypothetical protein
MNTSPAMLIARHSATISVAAVRICSRRETMPSRQVSWAMSAAEASAARLLIKNGAQSCHGVQAKAASRNGKRIDDDGEDGSAALMP